MDTTQKGVMVKRIFMVAKGVLGQLVLGAIFQQDLPQAQNIFFLSRLLLRLQEKNERKRDPKGGCCRTSKFSLRRLPTVQLIVEAKVPLLLGKLGAVVFSLLKETTILRT
jgi:hypothetical protein